jgi:peptidoglycan/xylan/chitin deacetylase (PgdA/CDA1 family)
MEPRPFRAGASFERLVTRILCYHSVDPDWGSSLSIPPVTFREQTAWLARNLRVLPLDAALSSMGRTGLLPRGTTSLTFDDGYGGVRDHAMPALAEHGLPASLFVVTGAFDGSVGPNEWLDDRDRADHEIAVLSADEVRAAAGDGWTIGSHSHLHRDLTVLTEEECERDLRTSRDVLESLLGRPVGVLAYPRGRNADHVRRAARSSGLPARAVPGGTTRG